MNSIRQTRIFVPRQTPFDDHNWTWTAIGKTIGPSVAEHECDMAWFWFSRYKCPKEMDGGDCDIAKVPESFMDPATKHYKSVRFRYAVQPAIQVRLESSLADRIRESSCVITDFRDYDVVSDLASDRFIEEPRTPERRQQRAELAVAHFHSLAKLVLHALTGPDPGGRFHLPHSLEANEQTPTPFHVIHHIFCNMTDVPLYVTVKEKSRWPWLTDSKRRHRVSF